MVVQCRTRTCSRVLTMSAASLDTSVPVMPMATLPGTSVRSLSWTTDYCTGLHCTHPMSAFLRAGESLTPSPVTATTLPALWVTVSVSTGNTGCALPGIPPL